MIGNTIYHPWKGSTLTSTGIVGHIIYYPYKGTTLISSGIVGHTIHYPRKGLALIFDHVRNQSNLHVERALHLHMTMRGTNPACQKGSALISDHVGTNPIITSERHAQHSHLTMWEHIPQPCQKGPALTSDNQCQKGLALTFDHARNQSYVHVERALHHIWSCRNQSHSHIRMALSPRLSIPGNWPGASIPRMAFNLYLIM